MSSSSSSKLATIEHRDLGPKHRKGTHSTIAASAALGRPGLRASIVRMTTKSGSSCFCIHAAGGSMTRAQRGRGSTLHNTGYMADAGCASFALEARPRHFARVGANARTRTSGARPFAGERVSVWRLCRCGGGRELECVKHRARGVVRQTQEYARQLRGMASAKTPRVCIPPFNAYRPTVPSGRHLYA